MVAVGRIPMLKVFNFFSQIIIILYMRLKFQSLNIMDPQNMSKPIPYCSNLNKIVFWPWEGVFFIEMKNFKNSLLLCALDHLKTEVDVWNSKIGILSPMAIYRTKNLLTLTGWTIYGPIGNLHVLSIWTSNNSLICQ